MCKTMLSLTALAAVLAFLPGSPAQAFNKKSFVSNSGNDQSSCVNALNACATFAGALAKTAPGGEIAVLNSGDYGPVLIAHSVSISNDGAGEASILAPPVHGIQILAGAGDVVSLRGIIIDGQGGGGGSGISIGHASGVHVQNCVVRNIQSPGQYGITFVPGANSQLFISDTIIFNNGIDKFTGGIAIQPQGAPSVNVVLDRVHVENNVVGLWVDGRVSPGNGAHVVLRDSVVSGNLNDGIRATSQPSMSPAFILIERTSSVNNGGTGILADGPGATMLLKGNTVARNAAGISAVNGGQLISYGNNAINNNLGPDGVPTSLYSLN